MSNTNNKTLFLLDGHALVYRAHYAMIKRPLINSKGLNTSAITGFLRSMWEVVTKQQPSHLAVSFDVSGKTVFRKEMFEEYKANRPEQPEDITLAFPYIRAIIEAMNIPILEMAGYEADDVIGTIAKQAEKEGFTVYMMTPDKDYAQLVSDKVFMYKPARFGNGVEVLGEKEVLEKWEIKRVEQVIDILGLQGDAVDNIPGIPGIGKKTAIKLLDKYDSVEGLVAHSHELKGKQKENVEKFAEQGLLSKELATIKIDVPILFNAEDCRIGEMNKPVLGELFKDLEFRTLAHQILNYGEKIAEKPQKKTAKSTSIQGDLFAGMPEISFPEIRENITTHNNIENTKHDYILLSTEQEYLDLANQLSVQDAFCFDTETTGIDANNSELVGLAFSFQSNKAYYVPIPAEQEEAKSIVQLFKSVLENEKITKVGQNIKYDYLILKWYGVDVKGAIFDTMIAHYLLEPESRHNLTYLSESYLDYSPLPIENLIGKKGKNQLSMRVVPIEKAKEYAGEDADLTWQLKDVLKKKLEEESLVQLYEKAEAPLVDVLVEIEYNGIKLDAEFLAEYSKELDTKILELETKIYEKAGVQFNIASPKQVGEVLFEKLQIPYRWRKTKSGQFSTNEEKLSEMAPHHPVVADILEYRSLTKLKSTYVDALPKMINPKTGRIHSSFNQALTATGRLSSNNPNLQNIPIRTEEGRQVRKAFVPRNEDYVLLAADYSQIELRLIAEMSQDAAMLDAFIQGHDIHKATAAKVFGVALDEVTADQRRSAKTVNFAIIYGAGATNLSKQLGIKRKEATELIKNYFQQYVGLKQYMDDQIAKARENGYVETLLGRRRYLRDINSKSSLQRSHAERNAINTPIQGTAADMIKMAMIRIHQIFQEKGLQSKMILQVHDELVFDAHKDELAIIQPIIEKEMKGALPNLKVPILVGMDTGENWLEAH